VVDVLADISNGTHPRPGDKPEHYHFMQAFYPYVLLYITAYFFQVLPSVHQHPATVCILLIVLCALPALIRGLHACFAQGGTGGGAVGILSNLRQYLWYDMLRRVCCK
jgi:hypothetical protein